MDTGRPTTKLYEDIFNSLEGGVPQPLCCSRINCTTNFKVSKVTHQLQIAQSLLGGISEIPPCWSNWRFCIQALKITILFSKQNSGQLLCNPKKLIQSRFPTNWTKTEKTPNPTSNISPIWLKISDIRDLKILNPWLNTQNYFLLISGKSF